MCCEDGEVRRTGADTGAVSETEWRRRVVAEARTWLRTPFAIMGRVRGLKGGVDCFTLLAEVFHSVGLTPPWHSQFYRGDFWCHDTKDSYLRSILHYVRQVPAPVGGPAGDPRPGNIVLALRRTGPDLTRPEHWHGGIITKWPMVVHAYAPRVSEDPVIHHPAYQVAGGLTFFNPFQGPAPAPEGTD